MRAVIQRVKSASVIAHGNLTGEIRQGLLVLVGIEDADDGDDVQWLAKKITALRIFDDERGIPNLSVEDVKGSVLVVSQFTLFAATKKGNRPGYTRAAKPDIAIPLYTLFLKTLSTILQQEVPAGIFGADMQVSLINDGPVTILMDTKNKE